MFAQHIMSLCLATFAVFIDCSVLADSPSKTVTPALTVARIQPHEAVWPVAFSAYGSIAAWQEAIVGSQLSGAAIVKMQAAVGDQVKKGQVLAELNPALLLSERNQLQAELAKVEIDFAQAETNRQRVLSLRDSGGMSEQAISQYVAKADALKAQSDQVKARLHFNNLQLSYTRIVAPDDGVISSANATLGTVAAAGQELFRLIRQNRLEWRGELTAEQMAQISREQPVKLNLPDGGYAQAYVRSLSPNLDPKTRLGSVYADIMPGTQARAGMYVEGHVQTAQQKALVIPVTSLVIRDGKSYVVQVTSTAKIAQVRLLPVTSGRRRDREIEILQGVTAKDLLVDEGAGFLNDGDWVRVEDKMPTSATAQR